MINQSAIPSKNSPMMVMAGYFLKIWRTKKSSILSRSEDMVTIAIWIAEKMIE
jgi:hypothetical protein